MKKEEFLSRLRVSLSATLPPEELTRHLSYYSEMIDDMTEDGMTEEEALEKLEMPEELARQILDDYWQETETKYADYGDPAYQPQEKRKLSGSTIALIIVLCPLWIPLAITVLSIVLALYVTLWAVVITLFAAAAAFAAGIIAGIVGMVMNLKEGVPQAVMTLGVGAVCGGAAIFIFYGALAAAKGLIRLTAWPFQKIRRKARND